ncbi:uncharacterized protein LOC141915372 [Tubulanus polymorphus]|uniref:uncharacterized protein LOC141915372 n=1 Tax=Tubulanus polymorphus TaxID=672921 RepID=UPI003DA67DB5
MGVQHVSESDVESVKMSKLKDNNCDLCDISYVTREELTEHYWSLMHHIKLEQRKKDSVHYCTICYASCENLTEYSKHLNGDQHRKALLEERKAKLRESDGSNSNVQTDDLDHAGTDDRSRPRSRTSNSTNSDYAYSRTGGSTERSHPYSGGSSYRNRSFESQNQAATNDKHYHHHHHHRSYSNRSQNSQIDENYQHHRSSSHRPQQNNPKRGFNNKKRGRGNRREGNTWHRYNRWTYHTTGRDAPNDLYDGYYKDCNKQRQYWNNDDYPIDGESFTSDTTEFIHGFDNHSVGDEVIPQHRDHSRSKSQEMMVDSVAVCQPETQQSVPRSRSRSPLKMKIPSLLDAPVKLASGYASVKWPIGYDVSTTEIDETPREDCGKTLLDKAENLCKTLREKREQAKADREKREKQDEKRQQHDELDKKIQDYSDVCQSKIKGILNETMDTTDLGSVTTLNETTSIRLPTSKENLTSLNQSTATETSSVSSPSTSTTVGKTSTRKHPVKSVDSAKVNFVKQNAEPMNKTQLMKMINAPRSLKERRHLEKILVNRPKKSSRPKLNLQPQVEDCQPVENVDVEELPDELRLKVEKLCDVEPLDCDSDTLLAQCSDLIDSNRYGGSALSESQSKRRHSLTSPPVSSFSMDTLNKKKRTGEYM